MRWNNDRLTIRQKINLLVGERIERIMATLQGAVDGWRSYAGELVSAKEAETARADAEKARADAAVAALEEANTRATANAEALAQFQADDAATDAQQLVDKEAADAKFVSDALEETKNPPVPVPDPTPTPEEPPVISEPVEETPSD